MAIEILKNLPFIRKSLNKGPSQLKRYSIYLISFSLLAILYTYFSHQIKSSNELKKSNLIDFINNNESGNLKEYFLNTIRTPYKEYRYTIKNNDSVEKILRSYKIQNGEVNSIINQLKQKKLTNIYSGREIRIVLKEIESEKNSVINITYPVSNTLYVEVRKNNDNFIVKKNIIKLNKREIVIKKIIKNNLYKSATESGIEQNIIIEFARIFVF